MGKSRAGPVDVSLGTIVWIRRRNGSWWPGRIIGTEDLDTNLISPRSGTPVKLLGREDASVDWYNLEKSKRVKAFRCGEFDECIRKAVTAGGSRMRKREKYARREDAILHALELEKELLLRKRENLDSQAEISKSSSSENKELVNFSDGIDSEQSRNARSKSISKLQDTSCNGENFGSTPCVPKTEEDQIVCGNDVPLGFARKPTFHCNSQPSSRDLSNGRTCLTNVTEHGEDTVLAKRSRCNHALAESSDALDSKQCSPSQMLSSPLGDNVFYPYSHSRFEQSTSKLSEDVNSDSSDSDSEYSMTEEDIGEIAPLPANVVHPLERNGSIDDGSMSGDGHYESSLSCDIYNTVYAVETMSNWQLKGKRRTRNLTRTAVGMANDIGYYGSLYQNKNGTACQRTPLGWCSNFSANDREDNLGELVRSQNNSNHRITQDLGSECIRKKKKISTLVDVHLKVQASYRKPRVPILSLMSELTGEAIIGHPILIEVLPEGSSDCLLFSTRGIASKSNHLAIGEKSFLHVPQPCAITRMGKKKLSKSNKISTGHKTRSLSSIGIEQNHAQRSLQMDRLIEPELSKTTTVACIPVKLVFSRLLEKIN